MARPTLQPHERKDDRLPNLRVTSLERADVERRAEAAGLPLVEYCRRSIFGSKQRPPMAKSDAAVVAELNRSGVNLNQITHKINAGNGLPPNLPAVVDKIEALIKELTDGS